MGVSIKSAEAERKLRRVSRLLGKSLTATVIDLADGRLKEIDAKKDRERIHRSVDRIVARIKTLPVLRQGTDEELLGYNEHGLFD
jgi:antitoxin VapB